MSGFSVGERRDGCRHAAGTRTRNTPERIVPNTITLSRLQLPPPPSAASATTMGGPPAIATFFSLPPAKKR